MLCPMNRPQTITADSNHSGVEALKGFSIVESAGTPAAAYVRLRKGAVGGDIIVHLKLAASGTANVEYITAISAEGGVYVEVVSGTVSGVLYY